MPPLLSNLKSSWWWKSVSSQYLTEMKKSSCNCLLHKVLQKSWIRQWRGDTTMQRWYSRGLYHSVVGRDNNDADNDYCDDRDHITEACVILLVGATLMMMVMMVMILLCHSVGGGVQFQRVALGKSAWVALFPLYRAYNLVFFLSYCIQRDALLTFVVLEKLQVDQIKATLATKAEESKQYGKQFSSIPCETPSPR